MDRPPSLDDGVVVVHRHARFELGEPMRAVTFAEGEGVNRESWTLLTAGLALEGSAVTGLEPFSVFEIAIAIDPRELDRVYPSLHRVGDGYVMYGPALALEALPMRVDVKLGEGQRLAPTVEPGRGYFYLGPDSAQTGSGFILTSGRDTPWLTDVLFGGFEDALTYYTHWLDDVPTPPTVFVSTQNNVSQDDALAQLSHMARSCARRSTPRPRHLRLRRIRPMARRPRGPSALGWEGACIHHLGWPLR